MNSASKDSANLPYACIVSKIDTFQAIEMAHREGFTSVSFTSVPAHGFDQCKDIARKRRMYPRDFFQMALRQLLTDRQSETINYPASRKGGVRRSLWLEDDLVEEMTQAAAEDNVSKTVFFLTALRRYAAKEGIDVEV